MGNTSLIHTALLAALIAAFGLAATGRAPGRREPAPRAGHPGRRQRGQTSHFVPLGVGKSVVIDLPRDIKDVLVADPKIANAVVRSSRRAYIIGVDGRPDQHLLLRRRRPADRRLRHRGDARPQRPARGAQAGAARSSTSASKGSATASCCPAMSRARSKSQQAFDIAVAAGRRRPQGRQRHHGPRPRPGHAQGDGRRSAARRHQAARHRSHRCQRRLGFGSAVLNFNNTNPFPVYGQALVRLERHHRHLASRSPPRCARWSAPASIRTLAEPNLTAISGETATFLAGGEFPVPAGYTCTTARPGYDRKLPAPDPVQEVRRRPQLHPGRAVRRPHQPQGDDRSLRALDREPAHPGAVDRRRTRRHTLTIPSIKTRRAETTVEIPSGGSLAMAGMIQEQTKQQINGIPGLMQLPILGTLFKSRDYINQPDRADDHRHALRGARRRAEGTVAARRRLCRRQRSGGHSARQVQPHLRRRRQARAAGSTITASSASFSTDATARGDDRCTHIRRSSAAVRAPPAWLARVVAGAGLRRRARRLLHDHDAGRHARLADDYRQRHPIAIKEGARTVELFIGSKPRRPDRRRSAPTCSPLRRPGGARRPAAS